MNHDHPTIAFTTLGCKVNQSETDLYARQFVAAGYRCVPFDSRADVYVVNTCTVTHVADRKSRRLIHQARRANAEALIVATGCYASIVGDQLADDRTLVIRQRDKERLVILVEGRLRRLHSDQPYYSDPEKYLKVSGGQERSRAMVKAQDGCDSRCTYCIIPRARGRSRSLLPAEVLRRVQTLVEEGHVEIVITGVDLGSYGAENDSLPDLGGLLARILDETTAPRIRVSSLEPGDFRPEWLTMWANPRLCRHLHVPLQAGSAAVLSRMDRTYGPQQFSEMVAECRRQIPGITITTDVMAGFPGETDAEFSDGLRFIREIQFDGMHVFKYSARSGTRAARLPNQVSEETKSERSRLLRDEAEDGVARLLSRHIGQRKEVAWETEEAGVWRGLSDTNVRVYGSNDEVVRAGKLSRVRLAVPFRDGLLAEPIHASIPLVSLPR